MLCRRTFAIIGAVAEISVAAVPHANKLVGLSLEKCGRTVAYARYHRRRLWAFCSFWPEAPDVLGCVSKPPDHSFSWPTPVRQTHKIFSRRTYLILLYTPNERVTFFDAAHCLQRHTKTSLELEPMIILKMVSTYNHAQKNTETPTTRKKIKCIWEREEKAAACR